MDTFYIRRNGLNDDELLQKQGVSPKIVDNLNVTKPPMEQVVVPAAGKSSVALNQTRQKQPPVEFLPEINIQQNQQNTQPQISSTGSVIQNVDLMQNTQVESQPINLLSCPQEVKVQEPGDYPLSPPPPSSQSQFVPTTGQIQIPLTAVPQDDGSQITFVDGQLRASQQKQRIPENPPVPQNVSPHPECPRCSTHIPPQGVANYATNGPVSVSNSTQQQPNSQAPEEVLQSSTATINSFQSGASSNNSGNSPTIPISQTLCSHGEQDLLSHKNLNGLRDGQSVPRSITEIKHPAAAYNAYNNMRAAGIPTKYGHNYFYR